MYEYIGPTVLWRYEAKPFVVIEELHIAISHPDPSSKASLKR
ncbi:hypothetical protein [Neorhizobium sp. T6_25]|nr:hypothetical protein [Neorhizobium sp. T6_25]